MGLARGLAQKLGWYMIENHRNPRKYKIRARLAALLMLLVTAVIRIFHIRYGISE